jgi:hypothetical protein
VKFPDTTEKNVFSLSSYLLLNSVEAPMAVSSAPPLPSPFRFFKKKLPKALRSNPTNGPKLICTNETKITTSGLLALSQMPPDDG